MAMFARVAKLGSGVGPYLEKCQWGGGSDPRHGCTEPSPPPILEVILKFCAQNNAILFILGVPRVLHYIRAQA